MKISRLRHLPLAVGAAAMLAVPPIALTQTYPARPVRIVVGFTPGGSTDIAARVVGQRLSESLRQQFIIENRPGANIATETVVRAAPDGYTLLLVNSSDAINATLYPKLNFDFIRDIVPVASMAQQPQVILANQSLPGRTFLDFVTYVKANPAKVNIASAGNGSLGHLAGELFKTMAGVDMVHVPYRGAAPALTNLLAGHVQISISGMAGSIDYVRAGKLRALAVTTATRSEALPDVPSVSEFLPGYEVVSLFGIGAPKNTPNEIVEKLNREINVVLADPKIEARFADLGGLVRAGSPGSFAKLLADETKKWANVIRSANIRAD